MSVTEQRIYNVDYRRIRLAIHFGTDGWRAVISEDFTFDNVRRVAQAIAEYFIEAGGMGAQTVVGFDTRFLSDRYAVEVARVLAGNNLIVHLANADAPTPAVSFAVKDKGAIGGVMITASHNPPRYNGIKLKAANGGSALAEDTRRVEVLLDKGSPFSLNIADLETAVAEGHIMRFDPAPAYEDHLKTLIDRRSDQRQARQSGDRSDVWRGARLHPRLSGRHRLAGDANPP